jgi:ABC-type transport system involved in cytochrome c biogenesis permease subunit
MALGLAVTALLVRPEAPALGCAQRMVPSWVQWGFYLLGAGGLASAAGAGLTWALLAATGRGGRGDRTELLALLRWSTRCGLLALGAGLVVGAWWAQRAFGSLSGGDPREGWLAATWLVAAASHQGWRLEKGGARWAAILAGGAATLGLVGVLVGFDLAQLLRV